MLVITVLYVFCNWATALVTSFRATKEPLVFDVSNINDEYFVVKVFIGENNQYSSDFLLDLATSGIYVTSKTIKNFDGHGVFNPDHSSTYQKLGSDDEVDVITVHNGEDHLFKGWRSEDTFGIEYREDTDASMTNRTMFFLITRIKDDSARLVSGSSSVNGYIGLAAMHQENETSYVQQLYDYKMIENPTFSMLLCKRGQCDSSLTIGGNSTAYAKEGAEEHT